MRLSGLGGWLTALVLVVTGQTGTPPDIEARSLIIRNEQGKPVVIINEDGVTVYDGKANGLETHHTAKGFTVRKGKAAYASLTYQSRASGSNMKAGGSLGLSDGRDPWLHMGGNKHGGVATFFGYPGEDSSIVLTGNGDGGAVLVLNRNGRAGGILAHGDTIVAAFDVQGTTD